MNENPHLGATIMPQLVFNDFRKWFINWKAEWFNDLEVSKKDVLKTGCASLTHFCGLTFLYQVGVYHKYLKDREYAITRNMCITRNNEWKLFWMRYGAREQEVFGSELDAFKKAFKCIKDDLKNE